MCPRRAHNRRAGFHQTGDKLRLPDSITLLYLPPYSPELNPVEIVWAYLRGNKLTNRVFDTYEAIFDAWVWFTAQPERSTQSEPATGKCPSMKPKVLAPASQRGRTPNPNGNSPSNRRQQFRTSLRA